ncbi:MAG: hypothetical protein ACRC20_10265 [Segniliparus sp.]|uniref:hypothetical protein n=1 Tax=Segniliparus sp. TaxID=2804064 RepID=UPI003F3D06B3
MGNTARAYNSAGPSQQLSLSSEALATVRRAHESYLVDLVTAAQFARRMRNLAQLQGAFGGGEDGATAQRNVQCSIESLEKFIDSQQEKVESLWEECRSWSMAIQRTDEESGQDIRNIARGGGI